MTAYGNIYPKQLKHLLCYGRVDPGGVLDISLGGEVRCGPSYPDPV